MYTPSAPCNTASWAVPEEELLLTQPVNSVHAAADTGLEGGRDGCNPPQNTQRQRKRAKMGTEEGKRRAGFWAVRRREGSEAGCLGAGREEGVLWRRGLAKGGPAEEMNIVQKSKIKIKNF